MRRTVIFDANDVYNDVLSMYKGVLRREDGWWFSDHQARPILRKGVEYKYVNFAEISGELNPSFEKMGYRLAVFSQLGLDSDGYPDIMNLPDGGPYLICTQDNRAVFKIDLASRSPEMNLKRRFSCNIAAMELVEILINQVVCNKSKVSRSTLGNRDIASCFDHNSLRILLQMDPRTLQEPMRTLVSMADSVVGEEDVARMRATFVEERDEDFMNLRLTALINGLVDYLYVKHDPFLIRIVEFMAACPRNTIYHIQRQSTMFLITEGQTISEEHFATWESEGILNDVLSYADKLIAQRGSEIY